MKEHLEAQKRLKRNLGRDMRVKVWGDMYLRGHITKSSHYDDEYIVTSSTGHQAYIKEHYVLECQVLPQFKRGMVEIIEEEKPAPKRAGLHYFNF